MDQLTHEIRLAQWTRLINDYKQSGLSLAEWCAAHDVTENAYYYWQRRVRKAVYEAAHTETAALTTSGTQTTSAMDAVKHAVTFAEVPVPQAIKTEPIMAERPTPVMMNAAITICQGSSVISIANTATDRLLKFVSEVIRNA